MTFKEAADFKMPFGKHKGQRLDEIATTDAGLRYLDWLHGERGGVGWVDEALSVYLSDKTIAEELRRILR